MTTTVRKGAGRPAANARRNRHAQTTPLPPKGAQTTEAKATRAALADPAAETPEESTSAYGRMTVAELKARASVLGVRPLPRTKGALMNAILRAERGAAVVEAQAEQDAIPQSDDAPSGAYVPETTCEGMGLGALEPKGRAKGERFSKDIGEFGWDVAVAPGEAVTRVEAVAKRGAEVITIVWDAGVFNYALSGHIIEDRTTKVRNVSHARQLAARSPSEAEAELNRVGNNKAWRPKEPKTTTPRTKLPFDVTHATDDAVRLALLGKTVVWVNRISQTEEIAELTKSDAHFRITGVGADRVVQFTTTTGFRAARLDKILRVTSKPTRRRAVEEVPA